MRHSGRKSLRFDPHARIIQSNRLFDRTGSRRTVVSAVRSRRRQQTQHATRDGRVRRKMRFGSVRGYATRPRVHCARRLHRIDVTIVVNDRRAYPSRRLETRRVRARVTRRRNRSPNAVDRAGESGALTARSTRRGGGGERGDVYDGILLRALCCGRHKRAGAGRHRVSLRQTVGSMGRGDATDKTRAMERSVKVNTFGRRRDGSTQGSVGRQIFPFRFPFAGNGLFLFSTP